MTADDGRMALVGSDVSVTYGTVLALDELSFTVETGEIVGFIGPNGAGKSTLANTIAGFRDYSGSVQFEGTEVADQRPADLVEQGLIYCTEKRDLFGFMSVEDNLRMGAHSRGWRQANERLEEVYDLFPRLEERTGQKAHTLSGGEQQMLALGRSLMGDPELLLLDEPTLGLAPVILDDISEALDSIADDLTVVICEQNVTFALRHADRIYLLEHGEIAREGTPDDLRGDEYVTDVYLGG